MMEDLQTYLAREAEKDKGQTLEGSVRLGVQENPDAYAKALRLAAKTGMAPEAVKEALPEVEMADRMKSMNLADLIQSAPKTAEWMSNPDHAAIAHDDLENLQSVERALPSLSAAPERTWKDKLNNFWRDAMEGTLFASDQEAQDIRQAESARQRAARTMGQDPRTFHTGNAATLPASRIAVGGVRGALRPLSGLIRYGERKTGIDTGVGELTKRWVETLTPPNPTTADTSVENFASTAGLLIPGMVAGKAVGLVGKIPSLARVPGLMKNVGPWAQAMGMAVPEAAAEAEDAYDTNIARGMKKADANRIADRVFWGNVALLTVTDRIGWFSKGGLGRVATSEAVQEGGQQVMGNTATGRPTFEGVPEAAAMGAAVATAIPTIGGLAAGLFKTRGLRVPVSNDFTQDFFNALADGATNSKLLARMPEKYQEAVQAMVKDGPVENLRIPAEAFRTFYQAKGLDPAEVAASLGVTNYMEATLSGNDMLIPTAAYATQIAGTEDHAELSKDMRMFEGQLTAREAEAAQAGGEQVAALAREVDAETQAQPEFQTIKEDLKARYIAAGESPTVAETYAMDGAKVFSTMATQAGMTPMELFTQYAPTIKRGEAPMPQEVLSEAFTPETFPAEGVMWEEGDGLFFQAAYHGSPYRFDKFSLEHMGKGEGAQAYGWGLYFAGDKAVGDYYRATLGANQFTYDGNPLEDGTPRATAAELLHAAQGDKEMAKEDADSLGLMSSTKRSIKREIDGLEYEKISKGGQLYEVEIPDDGSYLLWDKHFEDQPDKIKGLLATVGDEENGSHLMSGTGKQIYEAVQFSMKQGEIPGDGSQEAASKFLHSLGIAGIKYEDGASRGKDGEPSFNYVVFDDNAVNITKTFYQSGQPQKYQGPMDQPIPKGIHFDDLSPDHQQRVVSGIENDIQAWVDNPEEFKRQYREREDTRGGRLVNGDIINYMIPTVAENVSLGLTAMRGVDSALQMQVITLHKALRQQAYDLAGDAPIGITAGGQASGKTSVAQWVLDEGVSGAVIDAPHDDARTVERYLAEIKERGKDAQIVYVDRPDFRGVYRSMLIRATREGRMVPLGDMITKHLKVPGEMLKVAESNRNSFRVSLFHAIAAENAQPVFIGGPLSEDGKDAAISIRDRAALSENDLVEQARETYIAYLKESENGNQGTPALSPDLRREIEASFPGGMVQDAGSTGVLSEDPGGQRGQASDLQRGLRGAGEVGPFFQPQSLRDDFSFGSKAWQEYYRGQLGKNARGKGDQAERARKGMAKAATAEGQAEFDYEREAQARAEEEAFLKFDLAVSRVQKPRGWFSRSSDGTFTIGKTPDGDFSTFIHEPAHAYLEMFADLAGKETASPRLKEDWTKTLQFLGVESWEQVGTREHELWARANEAYVREGKAPSQDLRGVFQRFKVWLQAVYRHVSELDATLSDDIRGVFDRMRATDEEIEIAHAEVAGPQLFRSAEEAGMTEKDFKAYAIEKDLSIEDAKAELLARMNEAAVREKSQDWKREETEVRVAVTELIDARPEYRAIRVLRKGVLEDGTPFSLNRGELVREFGEDRVKELQGLHRNLYRLDGLMDAGAAAEILGFDSGEMLLQEIEAAPKRSAAIAQETRRVMTERHGDIRFDGTLEDQARLAVANEARTRTLHRELTALRNKAQAQGEAPEVEALRAQIAELEAQGKEQSKDTKFLETQANALLNKNEKLGSGIEARDAKIQALKDRIRDIEAAAKENAKDTKGQARAALAIPPVQTFREAATAMVEQKPILNLDANGYLNGQRRYSREAYKKATQGKFQEAAEAKQKELLNHFLYLESVKAKAEAEKIAAYGKRLGAAPAQQRIGKAQGAYLEQINGLLERFDFSRVTNKALREGQAQTLAQFVVGLPEGADAVFEPYLLDERYRKNYREMNLQELRAVKDALKNIEALARQEREFILEGKAVAFETAITEMVESARKNNKAVPLAVDPEAEGRFKQARKRMQAMDAGLKKVEWLIDHLDGGDINGPWRRYIFNPIAQAQYREKELHDRIGAKLIQAMDEMPKEQRLSLLDTVEVPGVGTVTRKYAITAALNMGNESNMEKMITGMGWAGDVLNGSPQLDALLGKLTSQDWAFVQKVWDGINELWPEIVELEKRTTGVVPPKVESRPFTVQAADGKRVRLEGGYFPIAYDPKKSTQGKKQEAGTPLDQLFESGYTKASTARGHTKERVAFSAPLLMDFEKVTTRHMAGVIKDISHREAAMAINRMLMNQDIRSTVQETMGEAYEAMLLPWLRGVVNDSNMGMDGMAEWDTAASRLRSNVVIAGLGFRVSSVLVQASDWVRATDRVKTRHLGGAILKFSANPAEMIRTVRALSPEMAGRPQNLDRDLRNEWKRLMGKEGWRPAVQRFAMTGLAMADAVTSVTTWWGAYQQALEGGASQTQAIAEADRTVRLALMTGSTKDQAAIQRRKDFGFKFATMFMGDATSVYGILGDVQHKMAKGQDVPRQAARLVFSIILPAILAELIKGRGPKDDEDEAWWAIRKGLMAFPSSIPILRDVVGAMESGRDYQFSPVVGAINKVAKAGEAGWKLATDDDNQTLEDAFLHALDASAVLFGLPISQAVTSGKYLNKVATGEETPETQAELVKNSLLGAPPKGTR